MKLSTLLFSACLAVVLPACGGGSSEAPTPAPAPESAPTPAPAPTPTPTPTPAPAPAPSPSPSPAPAPSAAACPAPGGRVLEVGPGRSMARPSAAADVAQSGDTIYIDAGDYHGDVATWNTPDITICGVGGRARLFADGAHAQGKGIWVLSMPSSATTTIVNVEFHGASVPDENGAGIRLDGGNLLLRSTGFYDNENGILGGEGPTTVSIESSEFARNGFGDGYTHNIYMGNINRLNVRSSFFHEAKIGHNLKSRAKENFIENSYFMDGPTGSSSYLLDFPDGGVVWMRGNLLHKGPNADNSVSVAYGFERNGWPTNTVTLLHNSFASTRGSGTFVSVAGFTQTLTLKANVFAGSSTLVSGISGANLVMQDNVSLAINQLPGADDVTAPHFWPTADALAQLNLAAVIDADYRFDAPQPYVARPIDALGAWLRGALQAQP